MRTICLDVASAPIANAADFIDAKPRKGTTDPEKQAEQVAKKTQALTEGAGLDIDLARITAIGVHGLKDSIGESITHVWLCKDEAKEADVLRRTAESLENYDVKLITFNGFAFDIPLLMRRARYLGIPFPKISTDRFKSNHIDLMLELSDRDPRRNKSLQFYCRRLGWTDICKTLSGEEESQVFTNGRWEDLRASVAHDVEATRRLAAWLGYLPNYAGVPAAAATGDRA